MGSVPAFNAGRVASVCKVKVWFALVAAFGQQAVVWEVVVSVRGHAQQRVLALVLIERRHC